MTDWQTARIVAMLAHVNSKRIKYKPVQWMYDGKRIEQEARERAAARTARATARPPLTGAQVLASFRRMGLPIIDLRKDKTAVIQ